jgi:hypothetical protein
MIFNYKQDDIETIQNVDNLQNNIKREKDIDVLKFQSDIDTFYLDKL